jgi:hypothetical protein
MVKGKEVLGTDSELRFELDGFMEIGATVKGISGSS